MGGHGYSHRLPDFMWESCGKGNGNFPFSRSKEIA